MKAVRRVYIAGPMTGLPEHNFPAFHDAARKLRTAGYGVCCPAENGKPGEDKPVPHGATWAGFMRQDLLDLLTCDAVATLDGWQGSRGASLEVFVACQLGMPVWPVDALPPGPLSPCQQDHASGHAVGSPPARRRTAGTGGRTC